MQLYSYLEKNYRPCEPIFLADIAISGTSDANIRQSIKTLCDMQKIVRYDSGIYYLPATSKLTGEVPFSASHVAKIKYIEKSGKIFGYYTGYTFANKLGLTAHVPHVQEITTNNAGGLCRTVSIRGIQFLLRKPRTEITHANSSILQLLDALKDFDSYVDKTNDNARRQLVLFIKQKKIKKARVNEYISLYPDKVYRTIYELELHHAFAQK